MPISVTDLKWLESALSSDTTPAQNGGRPTTTVSVSGVKNNVFQDVLPEERDAGAEHWRKEFICIANAGNLTLGTPRVSIQSGTPGDGYVLLHAGTLTDTEDAVTARPYGYGTLAADAEIGATSITVTVEHADYEGLSPNPFQVGDRVRIDARPAVDDSGDFEYRVISAVSYSGATLTLGVDALEHAYTAADGVHVASVLEPADLQTAVCAASTTGGVTYDDSTYPISVPQIGSVYQVWTITVTDAGSGALSVTGDTLGTVGTGATGVDLAPVNPDGGVYFTLDADGWGGTPSDGDTLTFTTTPAMTGIWYHGVTPAGSAASDTDYVDVCIEGTSY